MINYISIREVMDDLTDNSLLLNLTLERVVNYTVLFIRKMGMPLIYTEKNVELELKDYRCILPCDFIEVIQVTDDKYHSYRHTTDTFHMSRHTDELTDLTYKLLNNVLYSNRESGKVLISYRAIEVDEYGFPLLPDTGTFKEALELYIEKKCYKTLFAQGKLPANVYQDTKQEYALAVSQLESDLVRPSLDQMESLTNMWNQLLVNTNEHNKQYVHTGTKEYLKVH